MYYFDIGQDEGLNSDDEGSNLPGFTEAEHEACVTALQLARDTLQDCAEKRVSV